MLPSKVCGWNGETLNHNAVGLSIGVYVKLSFQNLIAIRCSSGLGSRSCHSRLSGRRTTRKMWKEIFRNNEVDSCSRNIYAIVEVYRAHINSSHEMSSCNFDIFLSIGHDPGCIFIFFLLKKWIRIYATIIGITGSGLLDPGALAQYSLPLNVIIIWFHSPYAWLWYHQPSHHCL